MNRRLYGRQGSIVRDVYLVSKWALIRRNELVDIPERLEIHPDFLQKLSHAEFESAFKEIGEMFYRMYSDIADSPQRFGLPLYKVDEYDYFSDQVEGPSVRYYYKRSAAYDYALTSDTGKLYLELRIRNAERCLEYLSECPERIVEIFRHSDSGCKNRINGSCRFGVKYEFEKDEKWHCGCCGAPFKIHPAKEDIPHYLKLMELGGKK